MKHLITWFGIVLAVAGVVIFFVNAAEGPLSHEIWGIVGPALTLAGFIYQLFLSGLKIESFSEEIKGYESKLDKAVEEVKRDLKIVASATEAFAASNEDTMPQNEIQKMASESVNTFLRKYYKGLVRSVNEFHSDVEHCIEFDHRDLIVKSVVELERLLPDGSIWCGVSLISDSEWDDGALKDFLLRSRERAKRDKLFMFRVYATPNHEVQDEDSISALAKDDQDSGVQVQINKSSENLKDISLAWRPKEGVKLSRKRIDSIKANPFEKIEEFYDSVGLLVFDVVDGRLRKLTAHSPGSIAFDTEYVRFKNAWTAQNTNATGSNG